jgi:hypothetical protein
MLWRSSTTRDDYTTLLVSTHLPALTPTVVHAAQVDSLRLAGGVQACQRVRLLVVVRERRRVPVVGAGPDGQRDRLSGAFQAYRRVHFAAAGPEDQRALLA